MMMTRTVELKHPTPPRVDPAPAGPDADASTLQRAARLACAQGNYAEATRLYAAARRSAPDWPDPAYHAATSFVLLGELEAAEQALVTADRLFPRGFFRTKSRLDCVRRELRQEVPRGTTRRLIELEWVRRFDERRSYLSELLADAPRLAQAWLELSKLERDCHSRLRAIDEGLSCSPDAETEGQLRIERALTMREMGAHQAACEALRDLLGKDPETTLSATEQARLLLGSWGR